MPLFVPTDFWMLRAPLLPLESYRHLQASESDVRSLAQRPEIQEAIAVASPALQEALTHLGSEPSDRKVRKVTSSVLRYLSRMTTRPTPFGLFAGVGLGELGERTQVELGGIAAHRKRSRSDMEWLLGLIHRFEQRPEVLLQLKVARNEATVKIGSRYSLAYVSDCGQLAVEKGKRKDNVSFKATPAVEHILELASEPIRFSELLDLLLERHPEAPREKALPFLTEIFSLEFLLSELRPPLTDPDPLSFLISRLDGLAGVEAELIALREIRTQMDDYDRRPIGQGLAAYQALVGSMKALVETSSPLQVDVALSLPEATMSRKVGQELARAAECLWRLSRPQRGLSHLRGYHEEFLERYGTAREVSVLELLSEEIGLGAPATYGYPRSRRQLPPRADSRRADSALVERILHAIAIRQREVELTPELADRLVSEEPERALAPESLELYAEIVAPSSSAIDDGDFLAVIGPNPGSGGAGRTFGRFLDLLGPDAISQVAREYGRQQASQPDVVHVEATYLPSSGRSANVALIPGLRSHELVIGTNPSGGDVERLHLDDLVVGATLERLYLKSRSLGKEVVVTQGHMLNYQAAPNILRFLVEVSCERQISWQPFDWGRLGGSPYLPRLRYGRTILEPATWRLSASSLGAEAGSSAEERHEALERWRETWDVPRYCLLTFADNRILLDLDNHAHREELLNELARAGEIKLLERVGADEDRWLTGPEGTFVMEGVFPLAKHPDAPRPAPVKTETAEVAASEVRLRMPGSDWLYAKLYVPPSREEEFVSGPLLGFAREALEEGLAEDWFYIRYSDPEPHVRLRFRGHPEVLWSRLVARLHPWTQRMCEEGLVQRVVFDTYDREVERYGGPELIDAAERYFGADSETAARLLGLLRYRRTELSDVALAALGIVDLLDRMGLSFEQRVEWARAVRERHEDSAEFRGHRNLLLSLGDPAQGWASLGRRPDGAAIASAFAEREEAAGAYLAALREAARSGSLAQSPDDILASLIHMFCNRLMGTDREKERRAIAFAALSLRGQDARRRAKAKAAS